MQRRHGADRSDPSGLSEGFDVPDSALTTEEALRLAASLAASHAYEGVHRAKDLVVDARTQRARSQQRRREAGSRASARFRLVGVIDGNREWVEWSPGAVRGTPALLRRAELIVSVGDSFEGPDGSTHEASLVGTPAQALLTFIRAVDEITDVTVTVNRAVEDPPGVDLTGSSPDDEVIETVDDVQAKFDSIRRRIDASEWSAMLRGSPLTGGPAPGTS